LFSNVQIHKTDIDIKRMIPFGLIFLLATEYIPLIIIFAPQLIPSTCVTASQLVSCVLEGIVESG